MELRVVGSGSKGNAYILHTDTGNLLIECGLPFPVIQKALDFDITSVQGCLLSHSHNDHSKCTKDVLKAGVDVYMTSNTASAINADGHRVNIIEIGKQFDAGDFVVLPVEAQHDVPCVAFLILYRPTGERILFATDTFYLKNRFNKLDYLCIESNYCKDTLDKNIASGIIPREMKNRLLESHFSLEHVKEFLSANDLSKVKDHSFIAPFG